MSSQPTVQLGRTSYAYGATILKPYRSYREVCTRSQKKTISSRYGYTKYKAQLSNLK